MLLVASFPRFPSHCRHTPSTPMVVRCGRLVRGARLLALGFFYLCFPNGVLAIEGNTPRIGLPELGRDDVVELDADRLRYDRGSRKAIAEGEVRLCVRDIEMRADELVLDMRQGFAAASGNVVIVQGSSRLLASSLYLELDKDYAAARHVLIELEDARTGRLSLSLRAERMERKTANLLVVDRFSFTTCDCPEDSPSSWSFGARSAKVVPDRGAWLYGTTFRIRERPVFLLPVFYLPLGERRSGLLSPSLGYSGSNGLYVAQPLYLALGRSYDLTLTAGWYQGREGRAFDSRPGVRGPEQSLELRWAPARRTRGMLIATHLFDLNSDEIGVNGSRRGSRLTFRASHTSRFDGGGFGHPGHGLHSSVNLLTDAALAGDLQPTLEQAQRGYVRSAIRTHVSPLSNVSLEAGARWLQDIRESMLVEDGQPSRSRPLFGSGSPETPQLLPLLGAGLSPVPIFGALAGRGELRLAAWSQASSGLSLEDMRLHMRGNKELSHPFGLSDVLTGRLAASLSSDTWRPEGENRFTTRLYPRLHASMQTGLERRYASFAHRIRPELAWRFVPWVIGQQPPSVAFDVYERPIPSSGLHQASVSVSNEVWAGDGRVFDAALRQGFDLHSQDWADLDFFLVASPAGLTNMLEARGGWDWGHRSLSWAALSGRLVGEGDAGLVARWMWLLPQAGTRLTAGLDEIFAAGAMPPLEKAATHEAVVGLVSPRVRGLMLRYDVSLELTDDPRAPQHRAIATYLSACRCWSGTLSATWPPGRSVPEISVGVQLSGIGSTGDAVGGS